MPGLPPLFNGVNDRLALIEKVRGAFSLRATDLAGKLAAGQMGADAWLVEMRQAVKDMHMQSLIIARGGIENVTKSDYSRLGYYLSHDPTHATMGQYQYLQRYARAVQENGIAALAGNASPYSEKYLKWRSDLYGGNAKASFYRGLMGNLLPQVPGDGQTQCRTNCKCELHFEEGDKQGLVLVYWRMNPAEHCPDCIELSQKWNPLEVMLPVGLDAHDLIAYVPKMTARDAIWLGGPGSGNFGHAGRPGLRGGSQARGAGVVGDVIRDGASSPAAVDRKTAAAETRARKSAGAKAAAEAREAILKIVEPYKTRIDELEEEFDLLWIAANHEAALNAKDEIQALTEKMNQEIVATLAVDDPMELRLTTLPNRSEIAESIFGMARNQAEAVSRVVSSKVKPSGSVHIDYVRGRSFYSDEGIYGATVCVNMDLPTPHTISHELGHWLEDVSKPIKAAAKRFLERRTKGDPLVSMKVFGEHYGEGESTKPDSFIHPYVGKYYHKNKYTEVISMGVEYYLHDPYSFASKDPEHFDLIYMALHGYL